MKKILLALLFAPMLGIAQTPPADFTFYNRGADIYVQSGALIHVQGSITNYGDAATSIHSSINSDGIIEIEGDLYNDKTQSAFTPWTISSGVTDGAVKMVGGGTQRIVGNFSDIGTRPGRLYNLVVDQKHPYDTVELNTPIKINGSLVFGTNASATYATSVTYPTTGSKGLLKAYYNQTPTTTNDFIVDIQNSSTTAIAGYPALTMGSAPTTGFILTSGLAASAAGGLQRKIGSATSYAYPVGTYAHGYNPTQLNFTAVPGTPGSVRGKFVDVTGYAESLTPKCVGCAASGPYATADNNGYNRFFASNACNGGTPQWIVLEQAIQNHGYWSYAAGANNTGYTYSIEVFPNTYSPQGNTRDTWRVLEHKSTMNDPNVTTTSWTSEIDSIGLISSANDLLTYTKNAGCYAGNGVPGGLYSDFSNTLGSSDTHFAMAKSKSNNALPVTLTELRADAIDNEFIKVSWTTEAEINNAGFNVMRSTDGVNFTFQGFVAGHNNSVVTESYAFDDHNVVANIVYYYKLEQVDNDGHSHETGIVNAIISEGEVFAISDFSPNPTKDISKLIINTSIERSIDVKLFDLLGRQLSAKSYNLSIGQNTLYFDVQTLADATYTAVITAQNKVFSKKLVVTGY